MTPLGFAFSDLNTIRSKVTCKYLNNAYEYRYIPKHIRKETTFLVLGKEFRTFLSGKKLLGRFLVVDSIRNLTRLGATFVDFKISGSNITPIDDWKVDSCGSVKTSFKRLVNKKDFLAKLIQTRKEEQKVFKHTLQYLITLYLDECKKKSIKPNKVEIVKALSGDIEFDFNNKKLKKMYSMFDSWKETNGGKRTLQAFHDICLNKTDFNKAVYDNLADPFSLKILVDIWTGKSEFKYFNGKVLSKRVIKLRAKKPVIKPSIKKCLS